MPVFETKSWKARWVSIASTWTYITGPCNTGMLSFAIVIGGANAQPLFTNDRQAYCYYQPNRKNSSCWNARPQRLVCCYCLDTHVSKPSILTTTPGLIEGMMKQSSIPGSIKDGVESSPWACGCWHSVENRAGTYRKWYMKWAGSHYRLYTKDFATMNSLAYPDIPARSESFPPTSQVSQSHHVSCLLRKREWRPKLSTVIYIFRSGVWCFGDPVLCHLCCWKVCAIRE